MLRLALQTMRTRGRGLRGAVVAQRILNGHEITETFGHLLSVLIADDAGVIQQRV